MWFFIPDGGNISLLVFDSLGRKVFPADANVNRILIRMNIFKNIGYIPSKTNHRLNQRILSKLIPPSIRYALHVNLVAHGGEMCVPRFSSCKCLICEVRKLCENDGFEWKKEYDI